MASLSNAELLRRVAELEAQNAALQEQASSVAAPSPQPLADQSRKKRGWPWAVLATVLIAIGAILAPIAVVASWAKAQLTDTDRFVAAYAPLANEPRIQEYITNQTLVVINERVDIPELTSAVIDGITSLGTGPAATRALELLKGPVTSGLQSLIDTSVTRFVASDAFENVWASALRVSHSQVLAAMQGDPNAAVKLGGDGSIGIQIGPIVEAVKVALLEQGIDLAARIPAIDRTVVIAQSDALPAVQLGYGLAVSVGSWLPWVALLFLGVGVLVARRRSVALIWAAVALALAMVTTVALLAVGRFLFTAEVSPALLPPAVAERLFETVAGAMRSAAIAVLVLAGVVAVVGWLAGPFEMPRRWRRLATDGAGRLRVSAEKRGITTGRTGEWVYSQRVLLRAIVAAAAAAVVLLVRPLTPGLVIWTLVFALVAIAIVELVQRPVVSVPAHAEDTVSVVSVD